MSVTNTRLVIDLYRDNPVTLYSTIENVKTMEIKSQRRKYFHPYWSNLKITSIEEIKERSLKESRINPELFAAMLDL